MSGRSYADAVTALNTLQSNHTIVEAFRKSAGSLNKNAIPEMLEWLRKCGYEPSDFRTLNVVHIAGTKGKGSTAAFVSSILHQYLPSASRASSPCLQKIGLFTSPHLRFVRERIQIDNRPISEAAFAKCFFEIWDRLEAQAQVSSASGESPAKPSYFRYLTIMALHYYLQEGVNSAVIECGIGGEYDSTNVIMQPTVTGISPLGYDHTAMLGNTIESIAWHKAGIMKPGAEAFTAPQPEAAMAVLKDRAAAKGVRLHVVPLHPQIAGKAISLGLSGSFQQVNASLAVALAAAHLRALGLAEVDTAAELPMEFVKGLETARLGGRCEKRIEEHVEWYIDGAHTLESIRVATDWYVENSSSFLPDGHSLASGSQEESLPASNLSRQSQTFRPPRILIFNQQTRAGLPLLNEIYTITQSALRKALKPPPKYPFDHAIFCSNVTFLNTGYRPDLISINTDPDIVGGLAVQQDLAKGWKDLCSSSSSSSNEVDALQERETGTRTGKPKQEAPAVKVLRTIEEAVAEARDIEQRWRRSFELKGIKGDGKEKAQVLVTGSMHLVGGFLEVLETETGTTR